MWWLDGIIKVDIERSLDLTDAKEECVEEEHKKNLLKASNGGMSI